MPLTPSLDSIARLREASRRGEVGLVDFARLLGERRDLPRRVLALEQLGAEEPGLERRLIASILPGVVRLASAFNVSVEAPIEPHLPGIAARTSVPRAVVARWLAHALLGTIEPPPSPDFPELDFGPLLAATHPWEQAKLRCLIEYFARVTEVPPTGRLEVERVVTPPRSLEAWETDTTPLEALEVLSEGAIEDAESHRQVDFANQYLGGGVLSGGCVQEEIRFAVAPELIFGMLLSPRMREGEAIILRGAERFARTQGYGSSLAFGGRFDDGCGRGDDGTPDVELVAIDAVDYRGADASAQYTPADLLRELGKARSGFRRDERQLPIASGNWGCGAFGGDPQLKAVIQWLAASAEGRGLRYFTFGDLRVGELSAFSERARAHFASVGGLARRLFAVAPGGGGDLYLRLLARVSFGP